MFSPSLQNKEAGFNKMYFEAFRWTLKNIAALISYNVLLNY